MKGLTFKLDYFTLFALVVVPSVAFYYFRPQQFYMAAPLLLIPSVMQVLWFYDLNRSLCEILAIKKKLTGLITGLLALSLIADLSDVYFYCERIALREMGERSEASVVGTYSLYFRLSDFLILAPVYIISIIRVKKFLYLRSWGFIILEIVVFIIGLVTLRPTLEEEYEERISGNSVLSDVAE